MALAVAALTICGTAAAYAPPAGFSDPVKLTQFGQCGGYEPGVLVDTFGNIVVTAHKQNHCIPATLDPQSDPLPLRGMSWLWTSVDGVHFTDMPDAIQNRLDPGDEGHLARDDAGNIYFSDLKVVDNTFASWKATGLGQITSTGHSAFQLTGQAADDRPWLAAHGNGTVLQASNSGSSAVYSSPNGNGSGRYTIYMSYDGGATFDHLGITIPNSGWCYPAADHQPGSKMLYVACADDGKNLFAYVSSDDGHTWSSHPIGPNGSLDDWPIAAVGPDGTVYVLDLDRDPAHHYHLNLFRSTDQGNTWTQWDATPQVGTFDGIAGPAWLDVAPDGSLGIDYYIKFGRDPTWHLEAGTSPGWQQPFTMADVSPKMSPGNDTVAPWGDFLSCAFGPDSRLHVVWTAPAGLGADTGVPDGELNSDIYYSQEALGSPAS
jgi:hypothetical protein